MKSMLRLIAGVLLFSCLLTFGLWRYDVIPDFSAVTQFAQSAADRVAGVVDRITGAFPTDPNGHYPTYTLAEPPGDELVKAICDGLDAHSSSIDVSGHGLTDETVGAVMAWVRYTRPEYFYVNGSFSYEKTKGGKEVVNILPQYLYDAPTTAGMMAEYNAVLDEIEEGAPTGSDFDRLLYLHVYFIQNYSYDQTLTIRDAHTFFTQKTGVCQAYMLALIAAADRLGIRSLPVTSDAMKHAWNLVLLDGAWYHVDLTWDDSVSLPTQTSYTYFLQSSQGLVNADVARGGNVERDPASVHHSWETAENADESTKYDNAAWREALSPMVKCGDTYYCVVTEPNSESTTARGGLYGGTDPAALTRLSDITGKWQPDATHYYVNCYAGLVVYGGKLIYNTPRAICSYDPATGQHQELKRYLLQNTWAIYGLFGISETGELGCLLATAPEGGSQQLLQCQIS